MRFIFIPLFIFSLATIAYAKPIDWKPINIYLDLSVDPTLEDILKSCVRRELRKFPDVTIRDTDDDEVDYKFLILGTRGGGSTALALTAFQTTGRKFLAILREKMQKDAPHANAILEDYVWSAVKSGRYAGSAISTYGSKNFNEMCLGITSFFDNNVIEHERDFRKKLDELNKHFEELDDKKAR